MQIFIWKGMKNCTILLEKIGDIVNIFFVSVIPEVWSE